MGAGASVSGSLFCHDCGHRERGRPGQKTCSACASANVEQSQVPEMLPIESVTVMQVAGEPNTPPRLLFAPTLATADTVEPWPQSPASKLLLEDLQAHSRTLADDEELDADCGICGSKLEQDDAVVSLPCEHPFHSSCIITWLERQHTCPLCRCAVETDDVEFLRSIGEDDKAKVLEADLAAQAAKDAEAERKHQLAVKAALADGVPIHLGAVCSSCSMTPMIGTRYKCLVCEGLQICQECHLHRAEKLPACESHLFVPRVPVGLMLDEAPGGPASGPAGAESRPSGFFSLPSVAGLRRAAGARASGGGAGR